MTYINSLTTSTSSTSSTNSTNSTKFLSGLVSGLDTESIVKNLVSAQQTKIDTVEQKKQILEWQQDDYRDVNTKLLTLRNAVSDLRLQGTFKAKEVTSSNESVLTATAGVSAVTSNYTVTVNSLATGVNKGSSAEITTGSSTDSLADQFGLSGDLTFTLTGYNGTEEVSKDFTIDTANTSINTLVSEINEADIGITASYDSSTDRFFLSTSSTGSDAEIKVSGTNASFFNDNLKLNLDLTNGDQGSDANIDFNGAEGLTFSSNQFTISGITFSLKDTGSSTLSVNTDIDGIVTKIQTFVTAYNSAVDDMNSLLSAKRDRDYMPLTDTQEEEMTDTQISNWTEKAKTGILQGDSLLTSIYNKIRTTSTDEVSGLASTNIYTSLSAIGINTSSWLDSEGNVAGSTSDTSSSTSDGWYPSVGTTSQNSGELTIDEDKLRAALADDPDKVMDLFTQVDDDGNAMGMAAKLYTAINNSMSSIADKAGYDTSYYDNSQIGKELDDYDDQISDLKEQLQTEEDHYNTEFSNMETALSTLNSQSEWLSSMLSSS